MRYELRVWIDNRGTQAALALQEERQMTRTASMGLALFGLVLAAAPAAGGSPMNDPVSVDLQLSRSERGLKLSYSITNRSKERIYVLDQMVAPRGKHQQRLGQRVHGIVQQRRHQCLGVELPGGAKCRHRNGVGDIGLTAVAQLTQVRLVGKAKIGRAHV